MHLSHYLQQSSNCTKRVPQQRRQILKQFSFLQKRNKCGTTNSDTEIILSKSEKIRPFQFSFITKFPNSQTEKKNTQFSKSSQL